MDKKRNVKLIEPPPDHPRRFRGSDHPRGPLRGARRWRGAGGVLPPPALHRGRSRSPAGDAHDDRRRRPEDLPGPRREPERRRHLLAARRSPAGEVDLRDAPLRRPRGVPGPRPRRRGPRSGGRTVVGLSFDNFLLDVEDILSLRSLKAWSESVGSLRVEARPWGVVSGERFKARVAEIRLLLEDCRGGARRAREQLSWHGLHRSRTPCWPRWSCCGPISSRSSCASPTPSTPRSARSPAATGTSRRRMVPPAAAGLHHDVAGCTGPAQALRLPGRLRGDELHLREGLRGADALRPRARARLLRTPVALAVRYRKD